MALTRRKGVTHCPPFIDAASVKERPSGGAHKFVYRNIALRQIFDV